MKKINFVFYQLTGISCCIICYFIFGSWLPKYLVISYLVLIASTIFGSSVPLILGSISLVILEYLISHETFLYTSDNLLSIVLNISFHAFFLGFYCFSSLSPFLSEFNESLPYICEIVFHAGSVPLIATFLSILCGSSLLPVLLLTVGFTALKISLEEIKTMEISPQIGFLNIVIAWMVLMQPTMCFILKTFLEIRTNYTPWLMEFAFLCSAQFLMYEVIYTDGYFANGKKKSLTLPIFTCASTGFLLCGFKTHLFGDLWEHRFLALLLSLEVILLNVFTFIQKSKQQLKILFTILILLICFVHLTTLLNLPRNIDKLMVTSNVMATIYVASFIALLSTMTALHAAYTTMPIVVFQGAIGLLFICSHVIDCLLYFCLMIPPVLTIIVLIISVICAHKLHFSVSPVNPNVDWLVAIPCMVLPAVTKAFFVCLDLVSLRLEQAARVDELEPLVILMLHENTPRSRPDPKCLLGVFLVLLGVSGGPRFLLWHVGQLQEAPNQKFQFRVWFCLGSTVALFYAALWLQWSRVIQPLSMLLIDRPMHLPIFVLALILTVCSIGRPTYSIANPFALIGTSKVTRMGKELDYAFANFRILGFFTFLPILTSMTVTLGDSVWPWLLCYLVIPTSALGALALPSYVVSILSRTPPSSSTKIVKPWMFGRTLMASFIVLLHLQMILSLNAASSILVICITASVIGILHCGALLANKTEFRVRSVFNPDPISCVMIWHAFFGQLSGICFIYFGADLTDSTLQFIFASLIFFALSQVVLFSAGRLNPDSKAFYFHRRINAYVNICVLVTFVALTSLSVSSMRQQPHVLCLPVMLFGIHSEKLQRRARLAFPLACFSVLAYTSIVMQCGVSLELVFVTLLLPLHATFLCSFCRLSQLSRQLRVFMCVCGKAAFLLMPGCVVSPMYASARVNLTSCIFNCYSLVVCGYLISYVD